MAAATYGQGKGKGAPPPPVMDKGKGKGGAAPPPPAPAGDLTCFKIVDNKHNAGPGFTGEYFNIADPKKSIPPDANYKATHKRAGKAIKSLGVRIFKDNASPTGKGDRSGRQEPRAGYKDFKVNDEVCLPGIPKTAEATTAKATTAAAPAAASGKVPPPPAKDGAKCWIYYDETKSGKCKLYSGARAGNKWWSVDPKGKPCEENIKWWQGQTWHQCLKDAGIPYPASDIIKVRDDANVIAKMDPPTTTTTTTTEAPAEDDPAEDPAAEPAASPDSEAENSECPLGWQQVEGNMNLESIDTKSSMEDTLEDCGDTAAKEGGKAIEYKEKDGKIKCQVHSELKLADDVNPPPWVSCELEPPTTTTTTTTAATTTAAAAYYEDNEMVAAQLLTF